MDLAAKMAAMDHSITKVKNNWTQNKCYILGVHRCINIGQSKRFYAP